MLLQQSESLHIGIMFDKIRSKLFGSLEGGNEFYAPYHSSGYYGYGYDSALDFIKGASYDNTYSSVKAIANAFLEIIPYAIDEEGNEVDVPAVNVLAQPNRNMTGVFFREALATLSLVHRKVYILVWHEERGQITCGEGATKDNIVGYTFLEGVRPTIVDNVAGTRVYKYTPYGTLTEKSVIELSSGIDPYNLDAGYSPSVASKKWANLDDYIATYQAGNFENGAVPAGQFVITASSEQEFQDIVAGMQRKHRGSGRNNNVTYVRRPIDPSTGEAKNSKIEWIPFAQSNRDLSLAEIFKQANEKIDSAFGVPASIRGVSDNNNYASSAVDERHFLRYTIRPFATKIYSAFTQELNRITGGLGAAITFDLEMPIVADEEKAVAERKETELDIMLKGIAGGLDPRWVAEAFNLDIEPEKLDELEVTPVPSTDISESVKKKIDHSHCSHKRTPSPTEQKEINKLEKALREQMKGQINKVLEALGAETIKKAIDEDGDGIDDETGEEIIDYDSAEAAAHVSDEELREQAAIIGAILVAYMLVRGQRTYNNGKVMLEDKGLSQERLELATGYGQVAKETKDSYEAYLNNTLSEYFAESSNHIVDILRQSKQNGWGQTQLQDKLRGMMTTDEWRIQRLARSEEHRANTLAQVDAMKALQDECGVKITKKWVAMAGACDYCREMDGHKKNVENAFLPAGGTIDLGDKGTFLNNFVDVEAAELHPNCRCELVFEMEEM